MDAAGEFAQFVEGGAQFAVGFGKQLAGAVGVRSELAACELERQPEREQALLCAVVEVALEPAALLVAGADDPFAGGAQLGQLGAQLGLETFVFEREPRRRTCRVQEPASLEQDRVVDECRDRRVGRAEHGHGAVRLGRREFERAARRVDVRPPLGQPERELERRVAERPRERVANRAGRRALELDHQVGDACAGAAAPEQTGGKRHWDGELGGGHDPEPDRVP